MRRGPPDGVDGIEGIQLTLDAVAAKGGISPIDAPCDNVTCTRAAAGSFFAWKKPHGANGGTSICSGATGHLGQSGGAGGSGGLLEPTTSSPVPGWNSYFGSASFAPAPGEVRSALPGGAGAAGANAAALGALTSDGYAAAHGGAGTNGEPGFGGSGGRGFAPRVTSQGIPADTVWRGIGGSGGGAGGCPGLAGTAGTGGGASIALALIDSPLVIDGSQLVSRKGGTAGRGTLGSNATAGGAAGISLSDLPTGSGTAGCPGGAPGVSTNGSSGPSVGILSTGAAPTISNDTKLTTGAGGAAIPADSRPDPTGVVRTIPATPAGLSKDKLSL